MTGKRKMTNSAQGRSPMLEASPGGDPRNRAQAHAGLVHDLEVAGPIEVDSSGRLSLTPSGGVAEVNEAAPQPATNATAINAILRSLRAAGLMED